MKNKALIGLSILSIFILCSLSYHPIIADKSIEGISKVKETKLSINELYEVKGIFNQILNMKFQSDCDCFLNNNDNTLICYILISVLFVLYSLFFAFNVLYNIQALQQIIQYLASHLESFTKIIHDWAIYYDCVGGFPPKIERFMSY